MINSNFIACCTGRSAGFAPFKILLGGRSKESWLAEKTKISEARKTWKKLLAIRDGMVLERKTINTPKGPIEVDVVPAVRDLIKCCEVILDRAVGKPSQQVELDGGVKIFRVVAPFYPAKDSDSNKSSGSK
jgi:hypothetical protein